MKGILWNSRGLRDLAKIRLIADYNNEHQLDFMALVETGKHSVDGWLLS